MRHGVVIGLMLAGMLRAQDSGKQLKTRSNQPKAQQQQQQQSTQDQGPPEEDPSLVPRTYAFNPLEAEKDLKVGAYYFKKGDYKAAASRFHEATLWNPTYADAFLRLGDSEEKMNDKKAARAAYEKYISLDPDSKHAASIKKKLARQR